MRRGQAPRTDNQRARSYRETWAAALRALRPNIEIHTAEPEMLDSEVERLAPQLMVSSRVTSAVKTKVFAWVELYPEHGFLTEVSVEDKQSTISRIELADLLSIVDQVEGLTEER